MWDEVDSDEGWFETEAKPRGIEEAEGEWEEGSCESEGVGVTRGGDRSGLRHK